MKINLPVTQKEKPFTQGTIVTKTDLKGVITYANDAFVDMSGFDREELIGSSQNIVRHPDMPPGAFADMWRTLKSGATWKGMVKNRCKNGNHYWVSAYVTPVRRNGEVVEYQSVRTAATAEQTAAAEKLWCRALASKARSALRCTGAFMMKKFFFACSEIYLICLIRDT